MGTCLLETGDMPAQFTLSDFKIKTACYIATILGNSQGGGSLDLEAKKRT